MNEDVVDAFMNDHSEVELTLGWFVKADTLELCALMACATYTPNSKNHVAIVHFTRHATKCVQVPCVL